MTTYTVTTGTSASPADYATLGIRATADVFNINGGYLRVDCDSRYGANGAAAASFGNIVPSATLGGSIEFNTTKVRLIPFGSGTGNVPAADTAITIGSASGKLIAVYSALNAAPTAAAAAMPASGYIKIRQWNSISYTIGALGGIGASSTAVDGPGWIECVGVDASSATINRLNSFIVRGDWYTFQGVTTTGTRTSTYQIPTNGSGVNYFPGVWVETAVASGVYEFYPCQGTLANSLTNIATDAVRGKLCWIAPATGLLLFGSDGTTSTGGYCPPSGCKIRIPNIFFVNCIAAASVNVLPNATLATRYKFVTTLAGVIDIDKCCMNWNAAFAQPFSVALTNTAIMTNLTVSEIASPIAWSQVGVGQEAANTQNALSMTLCVAGGTMDKCTWTRASAVATSVNVMTDVSGLTITNEETWTLLLRTGAATTHVMTRVNSCAWSGLTVGNGTVSLSTCSDVTFTNTHYFDAVGGAVQPTTGTANPLYVFNLLLSCTRIKIDGVDFAGLTLVQPYSGILNIGLAGNSDIKLRNLGTAAAPLDMGGPKYTATFTHSATTVSATKVAHGLKVNDIIYVYSSGTTACVTVGAKTVSAITSADVFTFTGINSGTDTSFEYYVTMSAQLVNIVSSHNGSNIKIQRCYVPHLRTNLVVVGDNSNKGLTLESVLGDFINAPTSLALNQVSRQLRCTHPLVVQNSVYGSHWVDQYTTAGDIASSKGYTQATTTATITSVAHGLRTGDLINVTVSSNTAIIVLGQKSVTTVTVDTFTFTCLTGSTTGTISYTPLNGRVCITMNEATSDTSAQVGLSNGSAFTSAGALYMPVIGHQAIFTAPQNIIGHLGFPIAEAVMATATIANYDITYSLNGGSSYHNLAYTRAGGGGTTNTTLTMTNATGVEVGDYVWGTNVAPNAKVASLTNSTTVVLDNANTGTVSGVLRFNHLPSETIASASVGFPLKIKIVTSTTNATGIPSLYFFTNYNNTTAAYQYPLETNTITFTGFPTGSDIVVLTAGSTTVLDSVDALSGTTYGYTYTGTPVIDIGFIHQGHKVKYIRNLQLTSSNVSLPVSLDVDLNFI